MAQTDLRGQVAIVTGASRGLGRHLALELARRGVRVAVTARSHADIERVAEEIRNQNGDAFAVPLDVARWPAVEDAVRQVRERFGGIDIVVNNAGVGWYKPFEEHSIEELDLTIDVNLKGTIYLCKATLPDLQRSTNAQIVNIASDLGRRVIPNMAAYVASKYGVIGFAGSLLRELKSKGIRITTVTPGIIDTFFNGGAEGTKDESWSLRPAFLANAIADLLQMPKHWVVDEIAIHAMGQEF
ncbi:MAG TPA: SDR family NAD(P)-dependent oxidoreductase [Thermoanaerobaculia bacterium]|nr:SDR family NAD(P)-dependent oxidoreductase [Thermoanaerobaculia bacterium]